MKWFKKSFWILVLLSLVVAIGTYGNGLDLAKLVESLRAAIEGSVYYVAESIKPVLSLAVK